MKDIMNKYYGRVRLSPENKQEMLANILKAGSPRRTAHQPAWRIAAAAAAVAAVALAVTLPPSLSGRDGAAATRSASPLETEQAVPVRETEPAPETRGYAAAIVLSVNPDVEIRLDADGVVTEVIGLNEDGAALIEGIDFAGMSLENATIMVVNQLILQGYITAAEIQEEINLSLSSDTLTMDTLSVMTNIIRAAAADQNIAVDVIEDAQAKTLRIVLEGEGNPEIWPELTPKDDEGGAAPGEEPGGADAVIGLEVEFVMEKGHHSAYVENVLIHTREGETIPNLLDFAGMNLQRAALNGIVELMEKGYIPGAGGDTIRFFFTGPCGDSDLWGLSELTKLLVAEYDLPIAVITDAEAKEIRLILDETVTHEPQAAKYALRDVLNYMVNKDEADLSPRQIAILKTALNYRQYQSLLEKRYFVVIPDLVGLTEERAVEMLRQLDFVPVVVREKIAGYDPELENGGLPAPSDQREGEDAGASGPVWEYPVVGFGCVFYQDIEKGSAYQAGLHMQINVVVPEDDERPEVLDFREKSGIVIREMDAPFDISAYPDAFSLSDAAGFDVMIKEMNVTYAITDKADYQVTVDRDTGWEGVAIITIAHKDGFPMSKFFVQDGRIIEHEFLWRRNAPAAPAAVGGK